MNKGLVLRNPRTVVKIIFYALCDELIKICCSM